MAVSSVVVVDDVGDTILTHCSLFPLLFVHFSPFERADNTRICNLSTSSVPQFTTQVYSPIYSAYICWFPRIILINSKLMYLRCTLMSLHISPSSSFFTMHFIFPHSICRRHRPSTQHTDFKCSPLSFPIRNEWFFVNNSFINAWDPCSVRIASNHYLQSSDLFVPDGWISHSRTFPLTSSKTVSFSESRCVLQVNSRFAASISLRFSQQLCNGNVFPRRERQVSHKASRDPPFPLQYSFSWFLIL